MDEVSIPDCAAGASRPSAPAKDAIQTASPSPQISFRLKDEEKSLIERSARRARMSLTQFVLHASLEKAGDVMHGAREKRDTAEIALAHIVRSYRMIDELAAALLPEDRIAALRGTVRAKVTQDLVRLGLIPDGDAATGEREA